MTVLEVLDEFWMDCRLQEMSREEMRAELIAAGLDPDANVSKG